MSTFLQEKPNSLQMMEKFNTAVRDIDNLNLQLSRATEKINTKLSIINHINAYNSYLEKSILEEAAPRKEHRIIFGHEKNKIVGGNYDTYGEVVHARYVQMPTNVFNILTQAGPIFKENVSVRLLQNDEAVEGFRDEHRNADILKHESDTTKEDVFGVLASDRVTLVVEVNGIRERSNKLIGGTMFDTIELCPYLPGSFDIEWIKLYTVENALSGNTEIPEKTFYGSGDNNPGEILIRDAGNIRFFLGKAYNLYKIEFELRLKYSDSGGGYPFGFRHLYFYDTKSDTGSDYVVVEVECDDYINHIEETIVLHKADGFSYEVSSSRYSIEYYMYYNNNVLDQKIEPNAAIPRRIKTFYAKIPLTEILTGIDFRPRFN